MAPSIGRHSTLGIVLILVGPALLLGQLHILHLSWSAIIWGALGVWGVYQVVRGFQREGQGVFWGTLLFGIGLHVISRELGWPWIPWYDVFPASIILCGAALLLSWLAGPRRWHLIVPATILIALGTAMTLAEEGYFDRWEVIDTVRMWWPAALILFGGALLLNARHEFSK